jgi:hypothetical protein
MRSTLRRRLRRWRRRGIQPARGVAWKPGVGRCAAAIAIAAGTVPGVAAADSAGAHAAWSPPHTLSDAASAPLNLAAGAGIGAAGNAVVLWHSADGVESSVRAPAHGFGKPRPIPGSKLSMPDLRPRLAFDPRGGALAVWSYFEPHPRFVEDGYAVDYTFGLRVASRARRGGFGSAQTLTDHLDADPSADAAFDPHGNAVVIWTDEAGMHAAARPAGKRRFGHADIISQTQADPQVTVGSDGSATAAWAAQAHGSWRVGAVAAHKLTAFGSTVALKIPGIGKAKPVVAVDGRSVVTAAWSSRGRVMAASCSAAGRCGRATALSPAGEDASDPQVAVAADGTAVVAWKSPTAVSAALRRGHESFGRPGRLATLAKGQKAADLAVGVGPKGDAAALWTIHTSDGERVQAALRHGPRARFAKASDLTGDVPGAQWSDPQVVLGANGAVVAIWGALIDGRPSIEAATYGG